ncbi:MAG TPA: circadian clock KaiB family protein [Acidimicrobiia bacterium]|nr:circadian clock KaiB family protein [Acidimicrobiia bacterium]
MKPLFRLTLYIVGGGARSASAEDDLRRLCENRLDADEFEIEVVDVMAAMGEAESARILVTPTVVRTDPLPLVRVMGDLGAADQIADALGLPRPRPGPAAR